jgi:hypothetical protein
VVTSPLAMAIAAAALVVLLMWPAPARSVVIVAGLGGFVLL